MENTKVIMRKKTHSQNNIKENKSIRLIDIIVIPAMMIVIQS